MAGQSYRGPLGTDTNSPQIDPGTSSLQETALAGALGSNTNHSRSSGVSPALPVITELITLDLNIIYDASHGITKRDTDILLAETVKYLTANFAKIDIAFHITYVAGSAKSDKITGGPVPGNTHITSGAVEGHVNVMLINCKDHMSICNHSGGFTDTQTRQIFLVAVPESKFRKSTLTHEMGHLLRSFSIGDPMTGQLVEAQYVIGKKEWVDAGRMADEGIIDQATDFLQSGNPVFGSDWVDDSRNDPVEVRYKPHLLAKLGPKAAYETFRRRATTLDSYRVGARMIAAQRR